ncbi:MAG: SDR family oxidoreductase [Victivallaceae bacterium]|nr:SDR family oxidoreductase [Victivallaceae bacterium]MDD4181164.1 SDR family oxidoreductase [Victivallaceae bacterium]
MTKIFLTGITGLVGGAFATALLKERKDVKIVALTRSNSARTARQRVEEVIEAQCKFDGCAEMPLEVRVEDVLEAKCKSEGCPETFSKIMAAIEVIDGDVADLNPEELAKNPLLKDVNVVFHCAADVNLGKDPEGKTFNINFHGTENVLALAKLLKVKEFHYVSTAYVAGRSSGLAMEGIPPNAEFNNPYEESKYKAELLVRNSGIPFSIYRPSIITGRVEDGRIRRPLAFYRIIEFLSKLKKNQCFKQGIDPREWVDIHAHFNAIPSERVYFVPIDYVQSAITALFQKPVCNKTYHITGDSPVTTEMIDRAVCRTLRLKGVEVKRREITEGDEMIGRFLGDLLPYFASDIIFDQTNVREALGEKALDWELGEKGLTVMMRSFFLDFFPDVDWIHDIIKEDSKA